MKANPFCIVIKMALFLEGGETLYSQKAYSSNAFLKLFFFLVDYTSNTFWFGPSREVIIIE